MSKPGLLWERLRSSLWFVPALMVAGAVLLAAGLIEVEALLGHDRLTQRWPRLFGAGAQGARGLLGAIAGSMITVAGVTFSVTIVALALASSQYSSRILRSFMRDRANQTVLGVFVGVFAYCLIVLRTIRGGDEGAFVPALAVLGALALAVLAIGFLIFFIHHIADSIQATHIVAAVAAETFAAIDRVYPERLDRECPDPERLDPAPAGQTRAAVAAAAAAAPLRWTAVAARRSGYIQAVDLDALDALACERGAVVRMERAVGDFATAAAPLVSWSGPPPDDDSARRLDAACTIGPHRTLQQDAGFGIRQLVDVALKALSPGINDTTTAVHCIDHLGAIVARLAARRIDTPDRMDTGGRLRVIVRGPTFAGLLAEAFEQIRHHGEGNPAVLLRLLEVLKLLGDLAPDARRRAPIDAQIALLVEAAERSLATAHDRARVLRALHPNEAVQ